MVDMMIGRRAAIGLLAAGFAFPAVAERRRQPAPARPRIDGGAESTGWIDFDFFRDALIIVRGTLNGAEARILIDSGVSAVAIDRAFADRIGLASTGDAPIFGVSGDSRASIATGLDVRLAGLALSDARGFVADISPVYRVAGQAIDLILGRDLFETLLVDIDFPARKIAFHDPARFGPPAGAVAVPMRRLPSGLRTVPIAIEGGAPVDATFDLGARPALMVSPDFAEARGLLDGRRQTTAPTTGVGGTTVAAVAAVRTLGFAGLDLPDVPLTVPPRWLNDERNIAVPAVIGMGLLDRFRIVSDWTRDRLWLVPDAEAPRRPFRRNRAGLHDVREGDRLRVVHVAAGSPAAVAGWREEEEIVAVNGVPVDDAYYRDGRDLWRYAAPGTEVSLDLAGGERRLLRLADYY